MKSVKTIFLSLILACAAGCSSLPSRFDKSESVYPQSGYTVTSKAYDGFDLEVCVLSYSFAPNPEKSTQAGRAAFQKIANDVAAKEGRYIQPIYVNDMTVSVNRNTIDGKSTIYVTGRVKYSN